MIREEAATVSIPLPTPVPTQVLLSLRILLLMKPSVLSRVSHQVAYGLHELLKTNAANIHSGDDWATLFTLLECIGSGVKPPDALHARADAPDAGMPFPRKISIRTQQLLWGNKTQAITIEQIKHTWVLPSAYPTG